MIKVEAFADEYKFFKNIYSQINIADSVSFIGKNNKVYLLFSRDSSFYILSGEIDANIEFLKWIKEHNYTITMSLVQINTLSKLLKKNIVGAEYDEDKFVFKYLLEDCEFEYTCTNDEELKEIKDYNLIYEFKLIEDDLNKDVLEIYLSDGQATREQTNEKLIEIATTKTSIKSLLKSVKDTEGKGKEKQDIERIPENYLLYSDLNEYNQRYISIKSALTCNDYSLTLFQTSLTI